MGVKFEGNVLFLSGVLDSQFPFAEVRRLLEDKPKDEPPIFLDLSQIDRGNSLGMFEWIRLLQQMNLRFEYINTPVWLVEQFCSIDELLSPLIMVTSFFGLFACPADDSYETCLMEVGKEVPLLKDYSGFELKVASASGKTIEPDFVVEEYFSFLTVMLEMKEHH